MAKIIPWSVIILLLALLVSACGPAAPALAIITPPLPTLAPFPTVNPDVPASLGDMTSLQVVYPKNGDLWLWSHSAARQLTTIGDVTSVLPAGDGSLAAFTRKVDDNAYELWVIHLDGTGERLLVGVDDLHALGKVSETEDILRRARPSCSAH